MSPIFIGSEVYRNSSYGPKHPLAVPRVSVCIDLCRALGWLPDEAYREAPMATEAELLRFHTPAYIAALRSAEANQAISPADREVFRIGADGNPIYAEVFRRPAISAGGVMLAARLTAEDGIAHCPGGGTHHGRPNRASGFCFLNDPVLGLLTWLDLGLENIVYLDIDAHHGDGVQDAFLGDPRVLTISLHERNRWPFSGDVQMPAEAGAVNIPLPEGCSDCEFAFVMQTTVLPCIRRRGPQAIMLQAGADGLLEDPLAKLALSNNSHRSVVMQVMKLAPRLVVLGGGGYNPWSVGRCWALIWGTLNGFDVPERLPPAAEQGLRALRYGRAAGRNPPEHWFTTLRDVTQTPPPDGPNRD
ncbi:MAG TPA: acetoin utilization protein AcuC, partial [Rhodopila sp.]|uniref:acetoin utilization protein AcuC n=1 Tax=Rhodopila sp. TaxID=2480087 RepID=UPI002C633713